MLIPDKVSICMITYNHEKYIAQAIESIMMQQTAFEFELVIGEDCSTDATRRIAVEYKSKYPDKIKLLLPEKNLGMMNNFIQTLKNCDGEFVAICEGDDYWTDSGKLQKQVDFLTQHKDCTICFHRASIRNENNGEEQLSNKGQKAFSSIEDLLLENYICTTTCLFRNGLIEEYPEFFYKTGAGDWVLHILNASKGNIGFMEDVMAVYRIHVGGAIYTANSSLEKLKASNLRDVYTFESIDKFFAYKYHHIIRQTLSVCYKSLALIDIKTANRQEAILNVKRSLKSKFSMKTAASLLPLAYSPNPQLTYYIINIVRGKRAKK